MVKNLKPFPRKSEAEGWVWTNKDSQRYKVKSTIHRDCVQCGEPFHTGSRALTKKRCKPCYLQWRADMRDRSALKASARTRTYTCSICEKEGHNKSTCPERPASQELVYEAAFDSLLLYLRDNYIDVWVEYRRHLRDGA